MTTYHVIQNTDAAGVRHPGRGKNQKERVQGLAYIFLTNRHWRKTKWLRETSWSSLKVLSEGMAYVPGSEELIIRILPSSIFALIVLSNEKCGSEVKRQPNASRTETKLKNHQTVSWLWQKYYDAYRFSWVVARQIRTTEKMLSSYQKNPDEKLQMKKRCEMRRTVRPRSFWNIFNHRNVNRRPNCMI